MFEVLVKKCIDIITLKKLKVAVICTSPCYRKSLSHSCMGYHSVECFQRSHVTWKNTQSHNLIYFLPFQNKADMSASQRYMYVCVSQRSSSLDYTRVVPVVCYRLSTHRYLWHCTRLMASWRCWTCRGLPDTHSEGPPQLIFIMRWMTSWAICRIHTTGV